MGAVGTRMFPLSNRSWAVIISLVSLLTLSIYWNLRQHQLNAEERQRSLSAESRESACILEQAEKAELLKKRNAKWAGSDARLQELYREIDTLSRLNERVLSQPQVRLKKPATIDNPAETLSAP